MTLLTSDDVLNVKFDSTRLREGYVQDEVDELLDEHFEYNLRRLDDAERAVVEDEVLEDSEIEENAVASDSEESDAASDDMSTFSNDDEEFLWNIEKNRFKERRAKEEAERKAREEK